MEDQDRNKTRLHGPAETGVMAEQPGTASAASAPAGGVQTAAPPAQPARPPSTPGAAPGGGPSVPIGQFSPPSHRRQQGLASRSWIPVVLSFGTLLLVAIALVIYFSQHS